VTLFFSGGDDLFDDKLSTAKDDPLFAFAFRASVLILTEIKYTMAFFAHTVTRQNFNYQFRFLKRCPIHCSRVARLDKSWDDRGQLTYLEDQRIDFDHVIFPCDIFHFFYDIGDNA
jgi:hypothetical protein